MQGKRNRRPRGTGSFVEKNDKVYGQFRVRGKLVLRELGPIGMRAGEKEDRLREAMAAENAAPEPVFEHHTIKTAGEALIRQKVINNRADNTISSYRSILRVHLDPYFGPGALDSIEDSDVEAFIEHCFENDQSIKSTLNYLALLHAIFEYARKKKWCRANPCTTAEKPDLEDDGDIRFLDKDELEALYAAARGRLKHAPQSIERHHAIVRMRAEGRPWKAISTRLGIGVSTAHYLLNIDPEAISLDEATFADLDPVVYMTAAMTGLRRGELLAQRWMDIDWLAQKVRVRRKYSRGKFGPTKGKRPRAVPLPTRLARELELLFQRSQWQADEDLVFGHPITGEPLKERHLYARFKRSLKRAGVREVRFHDLRHTFGTMMAANPRVSMRRLQEWMGHRDLKTTLKYADYAPADNEAAIADETFGHQTVIKLSETGGNGDHQNAHEIRGVR